MLAGETPGGLGAGFLQPTESAHTTTLTHSLLTLTGYSTFT